MLDVETCLKSTGTSKRAQGWIIGVAGVALLALCLWVWSARRSHEKGIAKATEQELAGVSNLGRAQALGQIAQDRSPELQAARDQVARLKVQLAAALKSREPGQDAPAAPDAVVIQAQGEVIQAQDHKADLLEAQLSTVTAENQANHAAALDFQAEAQSLRKEIAPQPTRALGVLWSPADQTFGVCFDQDVWRIRLGVDVLQQRLPVQAGGSVKWTGLLRAQVRF